MNQVYNELLVKKKQAEIMAQQGKRQYEYDSDEDTEVSFWKWKTRIKNILFFHTLHQILFLGRYLGT